MSESTAFHSLAAKHYALEKRVAALEAVVSNQQAIGASKVTDQPAEEHPRTPCYMDFDGQPACPCHDDHPADNEDTL